MTSARSEGIEIGEIWENLEMNSPNGTRAGEYRVRLWLGRLVVI